MVSEPPRPRVAIRPSRVTPWKPAMTATSPASNPQTALAHAIHAYALEHLGKFPQAADELSAALPVLVKARGTDDAVVRRAQGWQKIADPNALQALSTSVTVHRP